MKYVCPECRQEYVVSGEVFNAPEIRLKCAKCSHVWLQSTLESDFVEPEPESGILGVMRRYHLDWALLIFSFLFLAYVVYEERMFLFHNTPTVESLFHKVAPERIEESS